jgi:phosphate transport system substrate-binding protein
MQTKRTRIGAAVAAILIASLAVTGCGSSGGGGSTSGSSSTLVGAGSTFVAPLVNAWVEPLSETLGITLAYSPIGSGGGIEQITHRTVDFGASDAPLTPDQQKACDGCVEIPWALGSTAIFYNLHGVKTGLHITGPVLAKIYLGQITQWNDPALTQLNPGINLPSMKITVVHRSDASGTTFNLTDYLSHVSPTWKSKVGASTAVNWPAGVGEAHSSGVAATVEQTSGAIGYAETAYATQNKLPYFEVQNSAGRYVLPGLDGALAAAGTAHFASDNTASIADPPASAADAYPISTFTYVIVPKQSGKAAELKRLIGWAVTKGQSYGPALLFPHLPQNVVAKDKAILKGL